MTRDQELAAGQSDNALRDVRRWPDVRGNDAVTAEEEQTRATDEAACPICGHPMFEHVIDHSTSNTVLICPTDERLPEPDVTGPYNELGMPASGRRLEKYERSAGR